MKVALACTGIGQVQRGFERQFLGIHDALRGHVDTTLFVGGAHAGTDVVRIPCLQRTGKVLRFVPLHHLIGKQPYQIECLTFGIGLHRHLVREGFDLVHCADSPLAKVLLRLRARTRARYRILYMEGANMPFEIQPRADFTQFVSQSLYDDALAAGLDSSCYDFVPCGVDFGRLAPSASRDALRRRHGIAPGTLVLLDVAAINRTHKRVDWLAREVSRVPGDVLLWLDGSPEDSRLVDEMSALLATRLRVTHVPTTNVGDLLAMADVFVHAALDESFGIAIVEALSAGLPTLVHSARHFRWMVEDERLLVDMTAEGALAARILALERDRSTLTSLQPRESTWQRFEWSVVREELLAIYSRAMGVALGAYGRELERVFPRPT